MEVGRREEQAVRILHYCLENSHNQYQFGCFSLYSALFYKMCGLNHFRKGSTMQVCDFLNTQSPVIPMRSLSGFWKRNHEYPLKRDHVLLFYKQYLHCARQYQGNSI